MSDIKIGDVVAWADVPDGALARSKAPIGWTWWYRRAGDTGDVAGLRRGSHDAGVFWPASEQLPFWRDAAAWKGWSPDEHRVTIVALGLTGQETADDLRRLAEVFEVRDAWERMMLTAPLERTEGPVADAWLADPTRDGMAFIRRLHAAGWRPGMTAEDAARLLAETGP